jgi:hypothetical protein
MAYKERVPTRSKSVIDNTILEQENSSTHFECKISYDEEMDIYNILDIPLLLYGCEIWTFKQRV